MICNSYKLFFETLANPTRLDIINLLSKKQRTVSEICEKLGLEQSRASHNLKALKSKGFVNVKPLGKQRLYELDRKSIIPILKLIDRHVNNYYRHYCHCHGIPWRQKDE